MVVNLRIPVYASPVSSVLRAAFFSLLMVALASGLPANFAQVDHKVWRSAQPCGEDFRELSKRGFVAVLNLRQWCGDNFDETTIPLRRHRVRMTAGVVRERELIESLQILKNSPGPIVVHCWHGSDRTGTVVALYRMAVQGWSRERAIAEFEDPRYGHHGWVYPQMKRYLQHVDIAAIQAAL
jgi:tyrosine-protein phosphatase SIW14